MSDTQAKQKLSTLMLGAIGVVYGDIGTSPLYAMKETFAGHHPLPVTEANVLGVLSVMFWTIMLLVSLKYVTIIMRADNRGEGGSLALLALASELNAERPKTRWFIATLGVFAAALFYGDSMITPAISVLSAVEGLNVVAPQLNSYVLPVTIMVLTASVHGAKTRHRRGRHGIRPDHDFLVRHPGIIRRAVHRTKPACVICAQSPLCLSLPYP